MLRLALQVCALSRLSRGPFRPTWMLTSKALFAAGSHPANGNFSTLRFSVRFSRAGKRKSRTRTGSPSFGPRTLNTLLSA